MDLTRAVQMQMEKDAERMIDRMIPPGGITMQGIGAIDLDDEGSAAFGQADLDERGSDAFGQMDLDDTSAFGEMDLDDTAAFGELLEDTSAFGDLGRRKRRRRRRKFKLRSFAKRLRGAARAKADAAKKMLRKMKEARQKAMAKITGAKRKEKLAKNPMQKQAFAAQARAAEGEARALTREAAKVAEQAVNPKITREEAKAAVMPEVKAMAASVAEGGREAIEKVARTGVPATRAQARQEIVRAVTGRPRVAAPPGLIRRIVAAITGRRAAPAMPARARAMRGLVGGMLTMGDMETVTQEPEVEDIVTAWEPDDIYGTPDIY